MGARFERIKEFFFEAAVHTWAAPKDQRVRKSSILALPGSEAYEYANDNLRYLDTYFVHGQCSGGQTII